MARGWDSCFQNIPPLSSDSHKLRTSESEESVSHHIESIAGQHDTPVSLASLEAPASNSNFNIKSDSSIGNSNSDCVYKRHYKERPWQADGENMGKDYLPRYGNGNVEFATDGLSSSKSIPSSYAANIQGLEQDCGMLTASFLEDYSDVSSCSDADVGETRPSCKFMARNSFSKATADLSIKHTSSEWLFNHTGDMEIPTEYPCPNMSETNVTLPSPSNVKAREKNIESAQDKTGSTKYAVKSYAGHSQSSATSDMVTTTGSETVETNDYDGCEDDKLKENSESSHEYSNVTGEGIEKYLDANEQQEKNTANNTTIMSNFDNEQDNLDEKVLQREIKGSFDQETEKFDNPISIDSKEGTDGNMEEGEGDKREFPRKEREESGQLGKKNFEKKNSPNPNSTVGQNENMETDCQVKKSQSITSQSSYPLGIKVHDCKDASHELRKCTNTVQNKSHNVKSCLQLSHQSYKSVAQDKSCWSPAVGTDDLFDAKDENEQSVTSHSDSYFEPNNFNKDVDTRRQTSTEEKTNATPCPKTGCNGPGNTSDSISSDTNNKNQIDIVSDGEFCLQPYSSSTDISPCLEKGIAGPLEPKTVTFPTNLDGDNPITSDNKKQSLEFCLQSATSCTDIRSCLEKERTNPAKNTNTNSSPDHHQSLHQSPVALQSESLCEGVAENARESFEELGTSTEEPSVLGVLYGEPLSREDSCDTDETKLDSCQYKDTSLARSDINGMNHSEGQAPPLKSSVQMRKLLQPVVILKALEPLNTMSNTYHCIGCQYTTHNVDHLTEHHHCCHSLYNFQYCKTCDLYLMRNEQAEKHLCGVIKLSPQPPSRSIPQKKKHYGPRKCIKCGLFFSKLYQYVKHMRIHTGKTPYRCNGCGLYFSQCGSLRRHKLIPGRCKKTELPVTDSEVVGSENKTPPQKELSQDKPYAKLPKCYVKLVDISKANLCNFCGQYFTTAVEAKKHIYNVHKVKNLSVSILQPTIKHGDEKSEKVDAETRGKYKCPLCPRLFKYSYNRARHLRNCVRESICSGKDKASGKYLCPLCNATFTLPSNRHRHINTVCLRECVNRLAKERIKPGQKTEQKTHSKESEQTQSTENEQQIQAKESEQKKQEPTALTNKPVPRHKCNLCPAVFCHASGKYRHMKKHELFKVTGKMFKYRNSVFSTMSKPVTPRSTTTEESTDSLKSAEAHSTALTCNFCGKCFGTSQSLKKHERNHKGEKPYHCLECGKGFKKRAYLIGHKIVHQRRIQCTVCRKILPTVRDLIQHRSSHLKRGMLQCPDCQLQFQYPAHLLRHLQRHKNRENKATQLDEKPQQKPQKSLESVKEDQSGKKQPQCSLCKEVFTDAQVLRKHCLTHISGSSSNQCPFCQHTFTKRRNLLRHMIKHTGDKPFSCNNCGRQFYRDIYLKLHSEQCLPIQTGRPVTVEPNTKKRGPLHCFYCPRVFSKKIRLKSHLRGHKTNSLLLCSRCGQYFGHRKLNHHQKNCVAPELNTGSSPSNTELSENASQTESEYQSQNIPKMALQSSATKQLQFKCPHCTRRFRYRSLLLRHLVSHTGVQPYACVHCGHRFRSQTMCLQHEAFCDGVHKEEQSKVESDAAKEFLNMAQAEGETEYKCKFCTKTFMKPQNLRRHILTHNEVKPYRCKACDSCFSRYDHLKVHQTRCKGKRPRLEVCIPKISLDDVGKGWKNKFGIEASEKQETFDCEACSRSFTTPSNLSRHKTMFHLAKLFKCTCCGSAFAHEKSLNKHRKMKKCRKTSKETNVSLPLETNPTTENVMKPLDVVRNRILQRIQPHFNKKLKYMCSYCPRAFGNSYQLGVHTRLHTGERPFPCNYCGQRFIRKDYVQRHFQKCTKRTQQNQVLCDNCGGFFPQVKLENHKKSCTSTPRSTSPTVPQQPASTSPPKGFSCAYCSSRFLLFSQLQEHFLNAHKMETMDPPVSTAPLQDHLSNIPKIKEEPLDESCDEWRTDDANLSNKLDTALQRQDPNPYSCPECNLSFVSKAGLTGHLRVHSKEVPFKCKACKRGFWNKSLLRNHYRKCRFERTSVKSTQQLEVPVKAEIDFALNDSVLVFKDGSKTTGTGVLQTNFSCKEDTMDESQQNSEGNEVQGNLSKEKKTVQYQCSECEKSFTDGLMLISHLEDHGREEQEKKRNTCTKCGRVCSSQGQLQKHMRTHGINYKFPCPDCSKLFYTLSDLEVHRTCHDLSRPYFCKLCSQRFWTRPSLCNHYTEDHPDDIFTCRFCNKSYSVKKSLARHYKKWHQKEHKEYGNAVQEKRSADKQSSSQVSTTGESDEDENMDTEDSDSDSAPYFPCHVCGKTFPTSESLEDHQLCHLGKKPHECAECGRCFFQASQLQQHQRMHKSEFQCQACGRGFVSLFALRKHKHTHGKSRPYRCSKCHLSFTGPTQLAEHIATHQEENFPCDMCSRVFLSKSSRAEHRKSHAKSSDHRPPSVLREEHKKSASVSESSFVLNKELKYRCGICSERFGDPEKLSEHGCMAAKERPYSCMDCDKHFLHASHLKKHRTAHQLLQPSSEYPCSHCNSSFSTSQQFLSHLKSHAATAVVIKSKTEGQDGGPLCSFTCPVCHQCFGSATELICHFPMHPESSFKCKICKMTFPSGSKLEEHDGCHLPSPTPFDCTDCGQSFLDSDALCKHHCSHQQHTKMEIKHSNPSATISSPTCPQAPGEEEEVDVTGEDVYNCPVCSMQFYSKSSLLEHQNKQHPNEKPFKCELCGKTFSLRRYLKEHERRHLQKSAAQNTTQSAEKKFKCKQCHTEFNTAQDLSSHMRFHAEKEVGEYRCDMCYKSFSQWSLLKQHQESHMGQVVYECNECDKAFAFPHLLEEHQQTHAAST